MSVLADASGCFRGSGWLDGEEEVLTIGSGVIRLLIAPAEDI